MKKGKHLRCVSNSRCRGVTLIEILLILGLLVIIISFAAPSFSSATARANMHAASENLQYSIRIARNTARMTESKVTMKILQEAPGASGGQEAQSQHITFSVSRPGLKAISQPGLQEYRVPVDIELVSEHRSYEFDGRGFILNPGVITLLSRTDESLIASFKIE